MSAARLPSHARTSALSGAAQPDSWHGPSRRRFLIASAGTIVVTTALHSSTSARADTPGVDGAATATVWLLQHDWGYPRGAHDRTSCGCVACLGHAANKVFATYADALNPALRAHPGCLCVPISTTISAASYTALFSSAPIRDCRTPGVSALLVSAAAPSPAVSPVRATAPVPLPGARPRPTPSTPAAGLGPPGHHPSHIHAVAQPGTAPGAATPLSPVRDSADAGATSRQRPKPDLIAGSATAAGLALPLAPDHPEGEWPMLGVGSALTLSAVALVVWIRRRRELLEQAAQPDAPE